MVSGSVTPLTLNPEPVTLIAETTTFAVPVFVTTTVFVLLVPTVALPKDSELGEIVADTVGPDPDPVSDEDTPVLPQPVSAATLTTQQWRKFAPVASFWESFASSQSPSRLQRSARAFT